MCGVQRSCQRAFGSPCAPARRTHTTEIVWIAGPIRAADGNPCGSVVVFEAADLAAAQAFAETDPYVVEGIFASFEVHETLQVFPEETT